MPSAGDVILASDALGIVVAPTTTSTNGTASSGSTETRDAVLGNYVFTAKAGIRYRATIEGMNMVCSTSGERYAVNIRTGGASTPTSASTLWGENQTFWVPATTSTFSVAVSVSFIPGAGVQTLSMFLVRLTATAGTATPSGTRIFYVEAIGSV